ncbi:MAG: ATP synthase subunit I, partial [Shewanella sp.]|uniref:ATP synthase subunit I n=1 Tax=Shewanella sp. TaxID=50422 RepID=UPI003C71BC36
MGNVLARRGRLAAYKLVLVQAIVASIISILFFVMWGAQYGQSALAGAIIAVLPNFVFATLAFSHSGASSAAKVIKSFYWGEAVKMLLTIALFTLL